MTPEKGTPEWDLWIAAIEVAGAAPARQNASAYAAKIPWGKIDRLRETLDALGVDWRLVLPKKEQKKYARHVPTDEHLYGDPSEPFLCSCGGAIRWMHSSQYHDAGWYCTNLSTPTAAFAKLPPPPNMEDPYL